MGLFPQRKDLWRTLGPGILFASTCIGVSHLVQSTRAGADFGLSLIWAVILANLFKYPFFEFGSRYANATGKSIIDGYREMGRWVVILYLVLTVGTMFFVVAAVGAVTAGFLDNLFGIGAVEWVTPVLFVASIALLWIGKYSALDKLIKGIGLVLLLSTLTAFILALFKGPQPGVELFPSMDLSDTLILGFVIALMGWMPTAVDLSAWNSLWTVARMEETGFRPSRKQMLFDFNFGYLSSAILALCFLVLGAFLVHGSGEGLPKGSADFAGRVVTMYSDAMGNWSRWIIAPAAFSIMLGTCIAVFDGYARAMERTIIVLKPRVKKATYGPWLLSLGLGAYAVVHYYLFWKEDPNGFLRLVTAATTLSFLIAPAVALANYLLVTSKKFPVEARPPLWLRLLAISGLIFLTGFAAFYVLM